ncbi:phospholipase A-2-activating protein [Macrolepiota fuliginosa MF-IS2]|uniref:Phospholipase A-2-activating protein n=1 Tax=Macrolepiota fuliginosa MF-IS2 TaxID=1400762 RepID=A0A9P5XAD6_9AGAR|nr:phospholipase A-2-activating protein [Macrolepiota fuliginosa MF-IS2]
MPYKLSATLTAHSSDVRALSTPRNDLVLSASRDTTAISWQKSENGQFLPSTVFRPGSRYVNSVAYLPPTSDAPKGYVVTGGQETVINVFSLDPPKEEPTFSLLGHTENVCTLDVTPGGSIISGSWDRTAKVWINFQLAYDLKGHQQSVWAVKVVDEEQFLTGSADKTIKLWQKHKAVQTFKGHQDAVRDLALIPDIGFASCSNDSEVRVWTLGGDLVYSLSGHTSFVYSLSVLPDGDIVSAGEDRSVRIWQGDECSQVIVHPAISVWAVSVMPNGDIVSGCSDGVVRIFSASKDRWASEQDLKEYDAQVASQALPSHQVGDVKKSDLPGPEALSTPGKKPGDVKMIKRGDVVEAHQWDSGNHQWQKIGDVVDAVGSGRKQLYEGKEYDYVFDVDIQDGVPPLKLPYNVTENPYAAAQRFLQANEISTSYIDQVVQFIEKNTAGVKLGSGSEDYVDPFTGASRYRSAGSGGGRSGEEYADPFTGASRYKSTGQTNTSAPPAPSYGDPFTGASRYNPSGTAAAPPAVPPAPSAVSSILPVTKALNFKQANISAMQGKFSQFNDALKGDSSTSSLAIPPESPAINKIFAYLSQVTASPPQRPSKPLTSGDVEVVIQLLERWPSSQLFPVFDLFRLLTGFSLETFNAPGLKEKFFETLFKAAEWTAPWSSPLPKARETNILLVLRTLANAVQEDTKLGGSWFDQILEGLGQIPYTLLNKTQRVAFATILFNVSCSILRAPVDKALESKYLIVVLGLLASETTDSEAAYRTLVALGNVAYAAKKAGRQLLGTQIREANQCLGTLPNIFPEDRIKNISSVIAALF